MAKHRTPTRDNRIARIGGLSVAEFLAQQSASSTRQPKPEPTDIDRTREGDAS